METKSILAGAYFAGMIAQIIIRIPYDRKRREIPKTDQRVTLTERLLLSGLFVGFFVLPLIYAFSSWLDVANYGGTPALSVLLGSAGAAVLVASLWLFWRSHRDLGTNWSPSLEIGARQTVVTQGIYRRIRHPMYASQFVWSLAQALLLQNWIVGWSGMVSFLVLYFVRVPREEQMMLDHFGDEYRAYCKQTGRIWPRSQPRAH